MTSLGAVLDVSIGLILTYLILGLVASSFLEFVSTALSLRGRYLIEGLSQLLGSNDMRKSTLFSSIIGHALLRPQGPTSMPSYVSADNFCKALIDRLRSGEQLPLFSQIEISIAALPDGPAKQSLTALLVDASGDLERLRGNLTSWFDDAMDRVSGSYKRCSQYILLAFGFVAAASFNIDSIRIASTLWQDPALRAVTIAAAENFSAANPTIPANGAAGTSMPEASLSALTSPIAAMPVPIGWNDVLSTVGRRSMPKTCGLTSSGTASDGCPNASTLSAIDNRKSTLMLIYDALFKRGSTGISMLIGWLITALATSLGAPFWFDLLQTFLNIRNTGPKPDRAT